MAATKRAAVYLRVSTDRQTVHNQLADLERLVQARGFEAALYEEVESAAKARPVLERLLADARAGRVDAVAVWALDRLHRVAIFGWVAEQERTRLIERTKAGMQRAKREGKKIGRPRTSPVHQVEFVALDDNFETTSATGRAMLAITLVFAQLERERTSERTREKVQARRSGWTVVRRRHPRRLQASPHRQDHPGDGRQLGPYRPRGDLRAVPRAGIGEGVGPAPRPARHRAAYPEDEGGPFTFQGLMHLLSSRIYLGERELDDGAIMKCKWPAIIGGSLFERVQAKLERSSIDRPSGKTAHGHVYLLDGLLRCGACGATMTRATGTGRGGTYFYYRCGGKHRTAASGCKVRDIPVEAVETFVIGHLKRHAVDPAAITEAVQLANAGRDRDLVAVEADLTKARAALAAASRAATALVDPVEQNAFEAGGAGGQALRARLREREAAAQVLRLEVGDLELRRDALRQKVLDAEVVAEGYRSLPRVLDAALAQGAHEELRALLQAVIDVVEWREDAANPSRGTATIQFFELPEGFWAAYGAQKDEQPGEPLSGGSPSCPEWLPRHDSNMRPGD